MPIAILACTDLMTASRLDAPGVEVIRCSDEADTIATALELSSATIFIDLQAFPGLPARLRTELDHDGDVYAFAPHVQEELMESARLACTDVLPRGAVVKRFAKLAGA